MGLQLQPFGFLLLSGAPRVVASGVIPAGGVASVQFDLVDDPGLPGLPGSGFFQAVQVFKNGQPGVGAFTNYVAVQ